MKVFGPILGFGVLLIAAPIIAGVMDVELGGMASAILIGFGILLSLISGIALVISNLYKKTAPDEAFVRSGMGGKKVVFDGGALVVGVIHDVVTVSLRTIRLVVERKGGDALLTDDKLRADIRSEFFVRVEANDDAILNASRSFGDRMRDPDQVRQVVEDKLISALRTVAARMTLDDLNSERDKFLGEVKEIVEKELAPNGLTLESATISYLDQTDARELNEHNVFDAKGMRKIAEVTQQQLTERNELVRQGEEARAARDVKNAKEILRLQQDEAEAKAAQEAAIAAKQAEETRRAEQAEIDKEKSLQVAREDADREKQVAAQTRAKAVEVAQQEADKAKQVAEQTRVREVAAAQEAAAKAEAARQLAEAEAEDARQKVRTVEVTQTAEREKRQQVIEAEAKAEQDLVTKKKAADAEAYKVEKEAEAKQKAADADAVTKKANAEAEATRARAEADKAAKIAEAEGRRASEMIPVDVEQKRVEVEGQRVDVDKRRVADVVVPELKAREESGRSAQEFELDQQRIKMEGEVGMAFAAAMGQGMAQAKMQLFGTPEDAARMMNNLVSGMSAGKYAKGVTQTMPPEVIAAAGTLGTQGIALLRTVADRLGIKMPSVPALTDGKVEEPGDQPSA